ncbi:molybdate ABC transporter substrate-binding protein [Neorhizobium galegae]|uniref:molybdate ABC transporter substrate-binding protein n=1 Tax=Neorhizobium galegae TaxID=399 RepID=UPI0012742388|nr:molybdate ABC transporter substrate-binding protein [Neorhizobium galegae]KAA9383708.1 molybdate ABC transporter substrate-binding protein [Neorhizobium galegae]KAB1111836.1 molybdate ABC transporter substrate-binding protein [Neorhizobium galegae]MCM2500597.1 molybdate ABC transporter substrate-binding protein [Neorhizobium galegae]MCQ1769933.1 molybdate ABC transporter substrate-binding protein [Neorhizobium galegae]MCQ1776010.1 molybdate ABC transporter substrate-binding protein [Neorhiz
MSIDRHSWTRRAAASAAAAFLSLASFSAPAAAKEKVTVFAAASMKTALDNANKAWTTQGGGQVTVSYAASSALAKQIESGAPADIFISADLDWMNYVSDKKFVKEDTRFNWLGNRIVLVAARDGAKQVDIRPGFDLAGLLKGGRLAMGAPSAVPAGKYGKASLERLGVWSSVEKSVASAESVRAALAFVSRGEAPYGIVYQTDAAADPGVAIVGTFPADSHPPIIYPIAILSESKSRDAPAYLDYLKSDKAAPFFEKEGFAVLK